MVHLLGAHVSVAGGLEKAFANGLDVGCTALQIFTKNANRWQAPPIGDAEAEVIEAQVLSTPPISGQIVRDVDFPEGVTVGAIRKSTGQIVKPEGGTRIDEGDVIVLFAMSPDVPEVERLFQVSIDFF